MGHRILKVCIFLANVFQLASGTDTPLPPPSSDTLLSRVSARNITYTNPILPGWHSDPSCVFVPKTASASPRVGGTTFCVTSTFLAFPGHPIYSSRDLVNWDLASHVITRPGQIPELGTSVSGQQEGVWAATLRYRTAEQEKRSDGKGVFYLATAYISFEQWNPQILVFTTTDIFNSDAWSDPFHVPNPQVQIDPDLFWDDDVDGKLYITLAGIVQSAVDLEAGTATEPITIWNGTGGRNPEGPHIYAKDGWYYLLISEFGTEVNHTVTIARSRNVTGPYESYANNPLLTNRDTDEYFQTVGHADLFQDASGNWWGAALATRSGPEWEVYPMGRETVLFPARWEEDEWPVLQPVRGRMSGWGTASADGNPHAAGPAVDAGDVVDFKTGMDIPKHWVYWRTPKPDSYTVSPKESPNALRLTPSKANLTGEVDFKAEDGQTFISRLQSHTLFSYTVDVSFKPVVEEEEVGVTVFLTQYQHIDLGLVLLPSSAGELSLHLRFRATTFGKPEAVEPDVNVVPVPESWIRGNDRTIRLEVTTKNETTYVFSAASSQRSLGSKVLGEASAFLVSGGSGPFTGTLVGVYATTNGGNGTTPGYISRWRYTPVAQKVGDGDFVFV